MRFAPLLLVLVAAACGGDDEESESICTPYLPASTLVFAGGDVADCEPIDARYTCDGEDVSPALAWEGVPPRTAELVLIVQDPDAPGGTFAHWLAYGIDPGETSLPEGVPEGEEVEGLRQGENDMGTVGYGGPCPPEGETHDYVFWLMALDQETGLEGGARRDDVLAAVQGHALGDVQLTAPYARP